ncbi:MAG: acetate kinase [Ferrovum sp.]|nr:acetate kinase [Ferrovum sp.]NDU88102.1 acetate kinase [Ferrovum sp.]
MVALTQLLVVNSGSSSLRVSLFRGEEDVRHFHYARTVDHQAALRRVLRELAGVSLDGVVHRLVHGGDAQDAARIVDAKERRRLESLIPLAPLHLPANLAGLDLCAEHFDVPQIACFDTAFHGTLAPLAYRLPIPDRFQLRKYGFHGLSYGHVAYRLPLLLGEQAKGNVVVAHLGQGASLCLLKDLRSVDTTMGFSPAGGVVMGTRSGDLDPGVMLALAGRLSVADLSNVVYHEMGLWALSRGNSADMQQLLQDEGEDARFAVRYFCRHVCQAIGSLAAQAGGLDVLVFTGGIGEKGGLVRAEVCRSLGFMGFHIDGQANAQNQERISTEESRPILVLSADEEDQMRRLSLELLVSRSPEQR